MYPIEIILSNYSCKCYSSDEKENLNFLLKGDSLLKIKDFPKEIIIELPFQSNISTISLFTLKYPSNHFDIYFSNFKNYGYTKYKSCLEMKSNSFFKIENINLSTKFIKIIFLKGRKKKKEFKSCQLNHILIYGSFSFLDFIKSKL